MFDINAYYNGDQLLDGRYRILKPLGVDDSASNTWLAIDTFSIQGYSIGGTGANVIDESEGLQVVIRFIFHNSEFDADEKQLIRNKYNIIHDCQHSNLLKPINFSITQDVLYLVFPFCEAGSSERFIGKKISNETIRKLIYEVASGLNELHINQPQILHQNLNPAHILIDNDGNFIITGYGFSKIVQKGNSNSCSDENKGMLAYMAPECFGSDYKPKPESDIWAFGATICKILTGQAPFGEEGGKALLKEPRPMPSLKGIPTSLRRLIQDCLQKDPSKRPTAHQIMDRGRTKNRPFYRKPGFVAVIVMSLILIGGWTYYYFNHPVKRPKIDSPVSIAVPTIERAKELLQCDQCDSITAGIKILDSLLDIGDYQAALFKSRLYFKPDPLRLDKFYDEWEVYRSHCQDNDSEKYCPAKTDQNFDTAHRLLYLAKELSKPNYDYKVLYYLGCDYKKGYGCAKNLGWARWCFEKACFILVEIQNSDTIDINKVEIKEYLEDIRNERLSNLTDVVANEPNE